MCRLSTRHSRFPPSEKTIKIHLGAGGGGERSKEVREAVAGGEKVVHRRRKALVGGGLAHTKDLPQLFNLFEQERRGGGIRYKTLDEKTQPR